MKQFLICYMEMIFKGIDNPYQSPYCGTALAWGYCEPRKRINQSPDISQNACVAKTNKTKWGQESF